MAGELNSEIRETSLARRLIDAAVREWLDIHLNIAAAGAVDGSAKQAVEEVRNLHLAGYRWQLTPQLIDELTRAGLLAKEVDRG